MNAGSFRTTVTRALTKPAARPAARPTSIAAAGPKSEHLQRIGRGAAGKRQHRADRQIDVAGGDDIGEADGDQRDLGVVEEDREGVGQVRPIVGPQRKADHPENDREDDRQRVAPRQELAEAAGGEGLVLRHRALGLRADDGDAADIVGSGGGAPRMRGPEAGEHAAADDIRLDQHGDDEDAADEGRDGAGGQRVVGLHGHRLAVDHQRPGDRHALAQHLVDEHDQQGAEEAAEDAAATAEDRCAADDHRGDDDQFGAEAGLGRDALVLGDRHQSGDRGAQRGEQEAADAHPARRDAGVDRRLLVAAGGEGLVAPAGLGEHNGAKQMMTSAIGIWLLKPQALVSPNWKNQR